VVVSRASYDNGMLTIELKRELPEAMKPRRIGIRTPEVARTPQQPPPEASDNGAAAANDAQAGPKRARRKAA